MTTTYAPVKESTKRNKRKLALIGVPVAIVLTAGGAWAAVNLFGFGSIDSDAANLKNLTVSQAKLTGSLVPGKSVGGSAEVGNENDFDVKVSAVILRDSSLQPKGAGCDPASLTVGGTPATWPGSGGGAGHRIELASPVTIPAGQGRNIAVANVVSQAASASALCGVKADFAVVASVGN